MSKQSMLQHIQQELKTNHVVLFMRGTPAHPKCGFSAEASKKLKDAGVAYKSVDVFSDPDLYDAVRRYTNYTHFPQMFVDGKFIGSNDNISKLALQKKL